MAEVVVDASALVDLLLDNDLGAAVRRRLAGQALHAPAHVDAEVLAALGRLQPAAAIEASSVEVLLHLQAQAPIRRHGVAELLAGAWSRRGSLRLVDALYVELAASLGLRLVTTDGRLRPEPVAWVVSA